MGRIIERSDSIILVNSTKREVKHLSKSAEQETRRGAAPDNGNDNGFRETARETARTRSPEPALLAFTADSANVSIGGFQQTG